MNTALRETIKAIDAKLFFGGLRKANRLRCSYKSYRINFPYIENILKHFKYNNKIDFFQTEQNHLGKLFDKHGSDKGYSFYKNNQYYLAGHTYNDIYQLLFFQHKHNTNLVIECGIYNS